jgi:hypothetical protein
VTSLNGADIAHSPIGTLWNILPAGAASSRLDAGGLDHFGPFLDFLSNERSKIAR